MGLLNHLAWGLCSKTYGQLIFKARAYVDGARNMIVEEALETPAKDEVEITHLFFHDQDCVVPEGIVERLLAHDLPVVGAVYFGKDADALPVAFDFEPDFHRITSLDLEGLNKVDGIGMGATLISLEVFKEMAWHFGDRWWFRCTEPPENTPHTVRWTGEDVWFAKRCQAMGIQQYLDGGAQCGHITAHVTTAADFVRGGAHGG
jgi:hypothetical protein